MVQDHKGNVVEQVRRVRVIANLTSCSNAHAVGGSGPSIALSGLPLNLEASQNLRSHLLASVRACLPACVLAYLLAFLSVYLIARLHACMQGETYLLTCLFLYSLAYLLAYLLTCLLAEWVEIGRAHV